MRLKQLFFLLFFPFYCLGQSEFRIENSKGKVAIPFKYINNLVFIPINVNGEELTFLLDTGVEQTILFSLDEKEEVKLFEVEKLKLKGLGSKEPIDSYKSSKNKVEVGDLVDLNHEIYIILDQDFNFSSQVGIEVNGIIGYNFFKNHIVEINYERKKIIVYNHDHRKINATLKKKFTKEAITIEDNKPYYISTVNADDRDVPSKLLIDTGNSDAIWIFTAKTDKIKVPKKNIEDYLGRGFSGSVFGKRARLGSFDFGRNTFYNPLVTFPDSISVRSVNFVPNRIGSIGSEVISRFTIVFDYLNKAIYTRPNNHIDEPFQFNMSGIEVAHAGLEWVKQTVDDRPIGGIKVYTDVNDERIQNNLKVHFELKPIFKVASVRPGSEAEKAGLMVDDQIIKINHQQSHGFSIQQINELLKSEEGKMIELEIDRKGKIHTIRFPLKIII